MNTANQNFKPSEGKREEFRKYLEKNGVMDALTKVLVNLYEEIDKPEDALGYIRDKLALQAELETYDQMSNKQREQEAKIAELEEQIAKLSGPSAEEAMLSPSDEQAPIAEGGDEVPPAEAPEAEAPQAAETGGAETEAPQPAEETTAEPAAAAEAPPDAPPEQN